MADHMLRASPSTPPYVAFFMSGNLQNDKLDETTKRTELVHAEFGSISLQKTCFFNRSFQSNRNTLAIGRYDVQAEPAKMIEKPPLTREEKPSFFALLRVYRDGPGAVVLTGNYEADGRLGSLHVDHTRGGARLFYPEDGTPWVANDYSGIPAKLNPVGIGGPLTLASVSANPYVRLPPAPLPVLQQALFTVYGEGDLVREDLLAQGADGALLPTETRYLQPSSVEEQRQTDPACNAQLAKQRATQKGTVE